MIFYLHCSSALFELMPFVKQKGGEGREGMEIEWNTSISGLRW